MNFPFGKKKKKTPMVPFSEFSASRERRMKPERREVPSHVFIPAILWALFLGALSYFLFFSEEGVISDIDVSGNQIVSRSDLEAVIHADMAGRYGRVFSKGNFFFVPVATLLRDVKDLSPYVESVSVRRTFPNGLSLTIEERPMVIVWRSSNGDFLLDENGYAEIHPNLASVIGNPETIILFDEVGRETNAGDVVTEANIAQFIPVFREKFESRFGKTLSPEVRVPSRFSGELLFHVEGGFDILLDSHQGAENILITLQAALDRGIPALDGERLSRVDLRTENRVYYTVRE